MNVTEFRLKLYPKDFFKVREFYESTLGFNVVNEWDRPGSEGVMFEVGGTILELLHGENQYHEIQGVDVSWAVEDIIKLWEELKDSQNVAHELRHNEWGDSSFAIYDPEDFKITFFTKDK